MLTEHLKEKQPKMSTHGRLPKKSYTLDGKRYYRLMDISRENKVRSSLLRQWFQAGELDDVMYLFYHRRTGRFYVTFDGPGETELSPFVYELEGDLT